MNDLFDDDDLEQLDMDDSDSIIESETDSEKEYEEEFGDDDNEEDKSKAKFFYIAFLAVIIIIIVIIVVILKKWNKGERLIIDEETRNGYNTESEDFYIDYRPEDIDGYVDDGELNICLLTDGTIGDIEGDNSVPSIIANATGGNVDALSLPTTISLYNGDKSFSYDNPLDAFSLYYIAMCFYASDDGDYTLMMNALPEIASKYGDNSMYYNYWDKLHKLDFDKYDVIILCYGYEDYLQGREFTGDEVWSQQMFGTIDSMSGALDGTLKMVTGRFPYAQVIVSSPSYFITVDNNGNMIGSDLYNTGSGNLGEYVINMKSVAQMNSVTFLDNYFGFDDYNCERYDGYLGDDGRPNDNAKKLIADHIVDNLYFNKRR